MASVEKGYLFELFTSIQGEGLWTGSVHHFIRFAGCNVGCAYCDTLDAQERVSRFSSPRPDEDLLHNPVDVATALQLVSVLEQEKPGAQALAVTGGEPLEQADFLALFLPRVKTDVLGGRPVLLETAGLHAEAMERLVEHVDMVSMDIKLATASGLADALSLHRDFLEILPRGGFYVKIVVNPETPDQELEEAVRLVADRDAGAALYLQPETRQGKPVTGEYLIRCWQTARVHLENVRIQPQLHRLLDMR